MKKIVVLFLAVCLLLSLTACKESEAGTTEGITAGTTGGTEPGGTDTEQPPVTAVPISFHAQYIRTNGYHEGIKYPIVKIIRSADELNAYYEQQKDTYDLGRKEKVYADTTIGFLDACEQYGDSFFDKSMLVMVLLEEGSGSIRHKVDAVNLADKRLNIYIDTIVPEICTDDMAQWHILVEVEKMELSAEPSVQVTYNGVSTPIHEPTEGKDTITLTFKDGKIYTFEEQTYQYRMLKEILVELVYDPDAICRCAPEYKAEIEGEIYGINISEGYARCSRGQAFLSREQLQTIEDVIEWEAYIAD